MKKLKSNGQKEETHSGNIVKNSKEWFMKAVFMYVKFAINVFIKGQSSILREI